MRQRINAAKLAVMCVVTGASSHLLVTGAAGATRITQVDGFAAGAQSVAVADLVEESYFLQTAASQFPIEFFEYSCSLFRVEPLSPPTLGDGQFGFIYRNGNFLSANYAGSGFDPEFNNRKGFNILLSQPMAEFGFLVVTSEFMVSRIIRFFDENDELIDSWDLDLLPNPGLGALSSPDRLIGRVELEGAATVPAIQDTFFATVPAPGSLVAMATLGVVASRRRRSS